MTLDKGHYCAWLVVFTLGIAAAPAAGAAVGEAARVRSTSPHLAAVIREATERSVTFRQLVADVERSDGIVYVEPGHCRHGVRSCLSLSVVSAAGFRLLRILVDPLTSGLDLMETIGHELRHVMEVLANPTLTTTQAVYLFYERIAPTVRDAFETDAAIHAGFAVRDEISRSAGRTRP
jgi:hypothetical protein